MKKLKILLLCINFLFFCTQQAMQVKFEDVFKKDDPLVDQVAEKIKRQIETLQQDLLARENFLKDLKKTCSQDFLRMKTYFKRNFTEKDIAIVALLLYDRKWAMTDSEDSLDSHFANTVCNNNQNVANDVIFEWLLGWCRYKNYSFQNIDLAYDHYWNSSNMFINIVQHNHKEMLKLLFDYGFKYISDEFEEKENADMWSDVIDHRWKEITDILLENGINPNAKGPKSKTAYELAASRGNWAMAKHLQIYARNTIKSNFIKFGEWDADFIYLKDNPNKRPYTFI